MAVGHNDVARERLNVDSVALGLAVVEAGEKDKKEAR